MFKPEDQHINKVIADSTKETVDTLGFMMGDLEVVALELGEMNKHLETIAECLKHFKEIHLDVRASMVE